MEWHPAVHLSFERTADKWKVPNRRPAATHHPLNQVTVQVKELHESLLSESTDRQSSSSIRKPVSLSSSVTRKGSSSVAWSGLDPLSAALLSRKHGDEDEEDISSSAIAEKANNHDHDYEYENSSSSRRASKVSLTGSVHQLHNKRDEDWNSFRTQVMNRFTTQQKLTIKSSFLSTAAAASDTSASTLPPAAPATTTTTTSSSLSDQVRNRLQQLDEDVDEGLREERGLTGKQFSERIQSLKRSLLHSWSTEQRVKALKIVIQSAKMLSDAVAVPSFYPATFCLVTGEILDHFASLVHNRMEERRRSCPDLALETCRNWVYKVSSIREIVPRFYVEAAILRTHAAVLCHSSSSGGQSAGNSSEKQMMDELRRLCLTVRGIADPLVAAYARAFLCRVADRMFVPTSSSHKHIAVPTTTEKVSFFRDAFSEVFASKEQLVRSMPAASSERTEYVRLFAPSLSWICKCLLAHVPTDDEDEDDRRDDVLRQSFDAIATLIRSSSCCPELNDTALIAVVSTFPADFLVSHFDSVMQLMDLGDASSPEILLSLGKAFASVPSPADTGSLSSERILRCVWSKVALLPPLEYLKCASAWIDFVSRHFAVRQVASLLTDVLKHTTAADLETLQSDQHSEASSARSKELDGHKANIVRKIVSGAAGGTADRGGRRGLQVMAMDSLQPVVQSIRDPDVRVSVSKHILQSFLQGSDSLLLLEGNDTIVEDDDDDDGREAGDEDDGQEGGKGDDDVFLDAVRNLSLYCKTVHDSVTTAISLQDERREAAVLIGNYVRLLANHCPRTLDRDTKFAMLLDARSDFHGLDLVLTGLVHAVISLILPQHYDKNKERDFVRSCLAFSFTTIPSIGDPVTKLLLLAASAEAALSHAALSQLDSFLKSAMQLLSSHLPLEYDPFFAGYCRKLMAILLLAPDHPDHEPLYLVKGLANVMASRQFASNDLRFALHLDLMCFLSVVSQSEYPVRVQGIDSNDVLYYGSPAFVQETVLPLMRDTMQTQVLSHISQQVDGGRQADCCLLLLSRLLLYSDLDRSHKLVGRLWNIMSKYAVGAEAAGSSPAADAAHRRAFQERMRAAMGSCPDPELRHRIMGHSHSH